MIKKRQEEKNNNKWLILYLIFNFIKIFLISYIFPSLTLSLVVCVYLSVCACYSTGNSIPYGCLRDFLFVFSTKNKKKCCHTEPTKRTLIGTNSVLSDFVMAHQFDSIVLRTCRNLLIFGY